MVSVNFRLGDRGDRTPGNCFKRGLFAQDAANSLSHLAHEVLEGDNRAAAAVLRRAELSLRSLAGVSTRRDAAAAGRLADQVGEFRRGVRSRSAGAAAKLRTVRLLERRMSSLKSGIARSCDAR